MRTPNEAKSPPVTPSEPSIPNISHVQPQVQPQTQPQIQLPPPPQSQASQNRGKYDENIQFQLQRAPASSTMSSIRSSLIPNLMPGT